MSGNRPVRLAPTDPDLSAFVRAGDGLVWGQACAEPTPLVDAALRLARRLTPLSAFVGLSWRDFTGRIAPGLRLISYGALGRLGRLPELEVVPCHFSALPELFAERRLPGDVALIQVAPPDRNGRCSLGVGADYLYDALGHARVVIAEVNDRCPSTAGRSVPWERLDAVLHTSRPLLEAPAPRPGLLEERIAARVAAIVVDGDTVQLGVGALPEAIIGALSHHRELGIHSGMLSDGLLSLIESGVVTNSRKAIDRGISVTGAALGSARLFDGVADRDDVMFLPVSYTHAPRTLAQVGKLAAINSALEVDLSGQANAETVNGRRLGAVGGQVDFLRAATANGGRPIVALPAERIVNRLSGPTSTSRSDVDWVVTEHGACSLRGLSDVQRRTALLTVAGAERAEQLARDSRQ